MVCRNTYDRIFAHNALHRVHILLIVYPFIISCSILAQAIISLRTLLQRGISRIDSSRRRMAMAGLVLLYNREGSIIPSGILPNIPVPVKLYAAAILFSFLKHQRVKYKEVEVDKGYYC
jgi:hypothetical protein